VIATESLLKSKWRSRFSSKKSVNFFVNLLWRHERRSPARGIFVASARQTDSSLTGEIIRGAAEIPSAAGWPERL